MQNYYAGFFISGILHFGLILSFSNTFYINLDLISYNNLELMPAYVVYEDSKVVATKIIKQNNKTTIVDNYKEELEPVEIEDVKASLEEIDLLQSLLVKKEESSGSTEELSYYSNLIKSQLIKNWKKPISAQPGMVVELKITLVPTGEILAVRISKGSGNEAFDRSALNAVYKVEKFEGLTMQNKIFEDNFRLFTLVFKPVN